MTGYATTEYKSDISGQTTIETTEDELAGVFQDVKSSGGSLDGAGASIDASIDDPLAFRDFLILVDGTIEFDPDHVREDQTASTSS